MNNQIKAYTKKSNNKLIAIASSETRDRMGDSLKASGWQLENFKKNPVLQFAHNYNVPPIGIAKNIRIEGNELIFEPVFHELTQIAREVKTMFESDPPIMRAFSVGFIPLEREKKNSNNITKQELLEISAVPVPAHQGALIIDEKTVKEEIKEEIKSFIKKMINKNNLPV